MATIGRMTVHWYRNDPRVIENVPEAEYEQLNGELASNAGYHTYQIVTVDGTKITLDKRGIRSVDFKPTGVDDRAASPRQSSGIRYKHPRS